ncbi:MAG: hypothetical protein KOO63_12930 [Bacteroidales bacterium]|nr:hypothetical protein [Candidatus Latescibacterota bacterium]
MIQTDFDSKTKQKILRKNDSGPYEHPSTAHHLCQPTLYNTGGGRWNDTWLGAMRNADRVLEWDPAAILSILSFHYAVGDMTPIRSISRNPWMSMANDDGTATLSPIPEHGFSAADQRETAATLYNLLRDEAATVCEGRSEIYILLSGGLDSRIVAGILAHLKKEGRLPCDPVCVTWGLENSRDVEYARAVAKALDFEWVHAGIGPETIIENIRISAGTGNLFPPSDLHCLSWFRNVSPDALVLAGSYGDSIGRAEFSGRHLLELTPHSPANLFGLVRPDVYEAATTGIMKELDVLKGRAGDVLPHVFHEYEQQCHYMRGMIQQAMNLVNNRCTLYQLFTDPSVYSYMWSIHPSFRTNGTYEILIELLGCGLARIPWARTNRALRGATHGARSDLEKEFHLYGEWISGPLYERVETIVDPGWFAETGIFCGERIRELADSLRPGARNHYGRSFKPYSVWLWLAGLKTMAHLCEEMGKEIQPVNSSDRPCPPASEIDPNLRRGSLRKMVSGIPGAPEMKKRLNRWLLRRKALKKYPPVS